MSNFEMNDFCDNLPAAIYWKNKAGVYMAINARTKQLLHDNGYDTQIIGKTDADIFPEKLAKEFRWQDLKVLATGEEESFAEKVLIKNGNGQVRYQHSIKQPLKDETGAIIGVIGITIDMGPVLKEQLDAKSNTQKTNILLLEDSPIAQLALQMNLQSWGLGSVDAILMSAERLSLAMQKKYDLIYLNIGILNTKELQKLIKIIKTAPSLNQNIPIIGLSVHIDEAQKQEYAALGIAQMVSQPLEEEVARQIAATFLQQNVDQTAQIVDWTLWRKRCGNHEDLIQQAWDITMRLLPEIKEQSTTALQTKDYSTLDDVVHKCYGGLRYCGLPILEAATLALEQAVRGKRYGALEGLHKEFIEQIDQVLTLKYNPQ